MSDQEIFEKISTSDHQAFQILFEKYFKVLILHVRPVLISSDACQEVIQRTFIKLWEKRIQLEIPLYPVAYLKKMAFYEALMYKRSQKTFDRVDSNTFSYLDQRVEQVYEDSSLIQQLQNCIQALPAKIQETFKLSRHEGLTQIEIAQYLNKARKTVEAQLSRSIQLLRDCIKQKK